jgi:hypothetical protein
MDLWYPPHDRPHLLEWWRPLLLLGAAARRERVPWPIHLDEFRLRGRVDRKDRPSVWIYAHHEAGELHVDATGQTYKFTRTPNARAFGRFAPCDVRTAIWRAGLPAFVEPVWYEEPPVAVDRPAWSDLEHPDDRTAASPPSEVAAGGGPARQRGHLTVYEGGRSTSLAG